MQSPSSTQPRRVPCQERGERRVAELIDAAELVIAEAGYESATMSAIAEHAGASIGSLYQFFPNKASITQALRTEYGKQFDTMCAPLADQAGRLELKPFVGRLIDVTVRFVDTHPAFLALLDAPRSTRTLPEIRNHILERFAGFFLAQQPRISKARAMRLATITMQIVKALNQIYSELPVDERRPVVQEFKSVLYFYLQARLGPSEGTRMGSQ
ncbi:MAG TPA: TetR/AcrR family transcriptional regulator [Candidatus Sulfopaludibacter sp.]|jgi:AcrR family transcriptional regulator|nr:TetR/AcrR family transcriptional regulator [Candidatus Sulfopaludibacter sp.]